MSRRDRTMVAWAVSLRAASLAALVLVVGGADAQHQPIKKKVPVGFEESLRLELGCAGCFPSNRKTCEKEQWKRCCSEEIQCHAHHCTEEVIGQLQANTKVRIREDFVSDDDDQVSLRKGMTGRVLRVVGDGDALIKFWWDEYDEEFKRQWVSRRTFWTSLELPERIVRMRAHRVVSCLDNCTLVANCRMSEMATLPKKKAKAIQACVGTCKLEACDADAECKKFLQAYATCKEQTSRGEKCSPLKGHAAAAEL